MAKTKIKIIIPRGATTSIDYGLVELTKFLSKKLKLTTGYGLGGEYGYGVEFENDIFMMHPFCWCEQDGCGWCSGNKPNFLFKPIGLAVNFYKWIGRDMEYSWYQPREFDNESDRKDAMDGILMSDGNIDYPDRCENARFQMTSKNKEFCEFVGKILPTKYLISGPHKSSYQNNGVSSYYMLRSLTDVYYNSFKKRWYRNKEKIIPKDININPTVMLFEYLGDGCLVKARRKNRKDEKPYSVLSTYGFKKYQSIKVIKGLESVGIKSCFMSRGEIRITQTTTPFFLDWIGACPILDYKHKWLDIGRGQLQKGKLPKNWLDICKKSVKLK
jgi:hypothetical protein